MATQTGGTETARWRVLDARHHLHPFTDQAALAAKGVRVITHAEGCWLWDSEGNRILDGMAGLWCVNVGYGRVELVEAARRQMASLPFYNTFFQCSTAPAIELAARLAAIAPGFDRVFFANREGAARAGSHLARSAGRLRTLEMARGRFVGGTRPRHSHSVSSQVSPTRSWPKLWCPSSWTKR